MIPVLRRAQVAEVTHTEEIGRSRRPRLLIDLVLLVKRRELAGVRHRSGQRPTD